jgi:peptidyl-prolyl cis-trans isomerase D
MLQRMRHGAQSFGAKVLVAIIIIVLALFGFGAFNIFVSPDPAVATVNGQDISRSRVETEVERQRRDILARFGDDVDPELIDGGLLRRSVIENLISRTLLVQVARDMNMAVSDQHVDRLIVRNPQFQVDGRFDPERFRMLVASIGHSPASFRREYASDLKLTTLDTSVTETPFVTEWELNQVASLVNQARDVALLRLRADHFMEAASGSVTEEDVEAYYDAYRLDFTTEERIDVEYVELSVHTLADNADIEISEDQLRDLYEQERALAVADEQRRAAHILISLDERSADAAHEILEQIEERLIAGEEFEALAEEYSDDAGTAREGGDLGYLAEGMLAPEFDAELWRMDVGDVSGPVETQFGLHLIKLLDVRRDEFPTFEEREPELHQQLLGILARERFADQVRELDRWAFEVPDSLEPLAEEFGLEIRRAESVMRDSGPAPFDAGELRREAFSTDVLEGLNSRLVTIGESAYVVRLAEHHEARQRPLDEVADEIRERLVFEEAQVLARQALDDAERRLREGDSAGVVARALGLEWQVVEGARRDQAELPLAVARRAFELPRPAVDGRSIGSAVIGEGDFAVVTVTRVVDGDPDAMRTAERESLRAQLQQAIGNQDFEALFRTVRDDARIRRRG